MISDIIAVQVDDYLTFQLKDISNTMDEAEYPGIRVSMTAHFDGTRTPLKVDISTGDVITPREIRYPFKLMLEDRSIELWSYNLETLLAEKLETVLSRVTANTRMRDFYDIYILTQLYADVINPKDLQNALAATTRKRGTEDYLSQAKEVFEEAEKSQTMEHLWNNYRQKFSYASELSWRMAMGAVRKFYSICESGDR